MRSEQKPIKEIEILINRWNILGFSRETRQTEWGGRERQKECKETEGNRLEQKFIKGLAYSSLQDTLGINYSRSLNQSVMCRLQA